MDLIDRQAAIDTILGLWDWETVDGITTTTVLKQTISDIKNIPRVESEPVRHGRWIEHKDYPGLAYLCSECGRFTTEISHFCPDCGAKMEVDDGQ